MSNYQIARELIHTVLEIGIIASPVIVIGMVVAFFYSAPKEVDEEREEFRKTVVRATYGGSILPLLLTLLPASSEAHIFQHPHERGVAFWTISNEVQWEVATNMAWLDLALLEKNEVILDEAEDFLRGIGLTRLSYQLEKRAEWDGIVPIGEMYLPGYSKDRAMALLLSFRPVFTRQDSIPSMRLAGVTKELLITVDKEEEGWRLRLFNRP